jgi:hypothetical protein
MVIHKGECWLYFANHDGRFRDWTTWCVKSKDSCRTWGKPEPIPAPIHTSTFVRNSYVRPNGELLIAYQHYLSPDGPKNPRNGIMISKDGGRTWSKAAPTDIPNPGSKITLYSLGGENVALLHNPNPKVRNPLSLWVSFDGMKTWPYRRDLATTPGRLNYPDGFVSKDLKYLHFAYDENRFRAIYYGAKLPASVSR